MISKSVELQPFLTPNYVIQAMPPRPRQEGWSEGPKYALRELEPEVLAALCDQFRREIFEKAGKTDPTEDAAKRWWTAASPYSTPEALKEALAAYASGERSHE